MPLCAYNAGLNEDNHFGPVGLKDSGLRQAVFPADRKNLIASIEFAVPFITARSRLHEGRGGRCDPG